MKKEKHDHKLTNILKFSIFGILMLSPFFAVISKVAYTTFNHNAIESYTGAYNYSTSVNLNDYASSTAVTNTEYIVNQVTMHQLSGANLGGDFLYNPSFNIPNGQYFTQNSGIIINCDNLTIDNNTYPNAKSIYIGKQNALYGGMYIAIFDTLYNNNLYIELPTQGNVKTTYYVDENGIRQITSTTTIDIHNNGVFYKRAVNLTNVSNTIYYLNSYKPLTMFEKNIFYTDTNLSNSYYSALNDLEKAPLYNWAKNTGIYQAINSMTTGLGNETTILPMLLAYWFILTAIYIVIDIIVFAFTYLTHFFS